MKRTHLDEIGHAITSLHYFHKLTSAELTNLASNLTSPSKYPINKDKKPVDWLLPDFHFIKKHT